MYTAREDTPTLVRKIRLSHRKTRPFKGAAVYMLNHALTMDLGAAGEI